MKRRLHSYHLLAILLLAEISAGRSAAGTEAPPPPGTNRANYFLIITGTELLDGRLADGHTPFLTRTLHPLGLHCVGAMVVDDRIPDIHNALRFATNQASLVLVTGGLGPTDNDVTRQALVEFTGIPVQEHPDALAELALRFRTSADALRENLRRQTRVPVRGTYLKNRNGTAVGLVFDARERVIVALPGPPRELQPMVHDELVPYLTKRFGTRPPGCAVTLRFVGLGQSQIDQTLKEHVPLDPDIILASVFEGNRVDFTFSLPDDSPTERARLRQLERRILQHLGEFAYADDGSSLEDAVVEGLRRRRASLAIVELGSGGALTATLNTATNVASVVILSLATPTRDKAVALLKPHAERKHNEADVNSLDLLSTLARSASGANAVVLVGEAQPETAGARSVEVLLQLNGEAAETFRVSSRGTDAAGRAALTTQILDRLRRALRLHLEPR